MEGHANMSVERKCEVANQKIKQWYKVSTPCLDDHQFINEGLETVGDLSTIYPQIILNCLFSAIIGWPEHQLTKGRFAVLSSDGNEVVIQAVGVCRASFQTVDGRSVAVAAGPVCFHPPKRLLVTSRIFVPWAPSKHRGGSFCKPVRCVGV